MSKEVFVFEVTDKSFEKYVIGNSSKIPVFVAFIGVWSEPCLLMTDMLSQLAKEFAEQFVLAKVDIDENKDLKETYKIENVPTLLVFVDGEVVATEVGNLSEEEARALLKSHGIVNQSEELRLQARQHHIQGETPKAITLLSQAMKLAPSNVNIAMDMVQILIDLGQMKEANALFKQLPESTRNSPTGLSLSGQLWITQQAAETEGLEKLSEKILSEPDNYDARFDCAICEIAQHNYQQAFDHLFYIQQYKADYKEGAAREMIVTLINTLAPNNPELAQEYRSQLAGMLAV